MPNRPAVICVFLAALSGCAAARGSQIFSGRQIPAFDPADASYIFRHGTNAIDGQAMIRRPDGVYATCYGDAATLAPDTAYTRARLAALYGAGQDSVEIQDAPRLPRDPQYERYTRHARCSHGGHFRFNHLADGDYVVIAALRSQHDGRGQGISIRQQVSVHGGETRRVRLGQ